METDLPSAKMGQSPPQCLLCPKGSMHQDATWYGGRPQPMRLCVRWGPSPPPQKKGHSPQFSAHVYCGQMAGYIRIPLGTEVGLSPGDIVLDGDPAPQPPHPIFGPFLLQQNGWMDQDVTWYRGRPWPRRLCVRWGPSCFPLKGAQSPSFWAHVYCGQTAGWMKMPLDT